MIITDKKKTMTMILARLKDGKTSTMPVAPEAEMKPDPDDEPLAMAAQDMLQAINDKSVHGLKEALKSFMDLCQSEASEQPSED